MLTTDTNVALDLSPTSFGGESPVAIFGFFLVGRQSLIATEFKYCSNILFRYIEHTFMHLLDHFAVSNFF